MFSLCVLEFSFDVSVTSQRATANCGRTRAVVGRSHSYPTVVVLPVKKTEVFDEWIQSYVAYPLNRLLCRDNSVQSFLYFLMIDF